LASPACIATDPVLELCGIDALELCALAEWVEELVPEALL
jgi:hypothetical protein